MTFFVVGKWRASNFSWHTAVDGWNVHGSLPQYQPTGKAEVADVLPLQSSRETPVLPGPNDLLSQIHNGR
jgi:hypothetical protein